MQNWKTTLAGLVAGAPLAIQALLDAYNAGQFTDKSFHQVVFGVAVILIGIYASDAKKK